MICPRFIGISLAFVAYGAQAAHSHGMGTSPDYAQVVEWSIAFSQTRGTVENRAQTFDPSDIAGKFKLEAHPEACVGTQESIEASGREAARQAPRSEGPPVRLLPESVPPGTPIGWRGFRFTDSRQVVFGTVCGVVHDRDTGVTVFVMSDTSPATHSGQASLTMRQRGPTQVESHILIPPNGYISAELVARSPR